MKKLFLLLSILTFTFTNVFAQGLQFATQEQLEEVEIWINEERGFSGDLPSSFTMDKYCPPILTQDGSSCVGWSVCYASMSIMYNSMMGITDPFQKWALAFDPYFMYASLKNSYDFECEEGLLMTRALDFLAEKGTKRWAMKPYLGCASEWTKDWWDYARFYSQPFALITYYSLPEIDNSTVNNIKSALVNYMPVMIGVAIDKTISPLGSAGGTVGSDGLWSTKLTGDIIGGHAMTIIAYDDYKFGGAFKVMNSWGRKYGDNGYNWIKYNDIMGIVKEAYIIEPKKLNGDEINETILTDYYTRHTYGDGKWKGDTYEGTIKDRQMHGEGYYIWSKTGDIYFGGYNMGVYNGTGILFKYQEETLTDFEYDNGVLISREERGFGAEKESEFDKYMSIFGSELKRVEADPDFEMSEMSDTKIKSEGFNFNKGGFNFNKNK